MPNPEPDNSQAKESKAKELLLYFFDEGISRVLPGLVVMVLYAHEQVIAVFKVVQGSAIIFGLSMLVAAWFIGAILVVVWWIPTWLCEWWDDNSKRCFVPEFPEFIDARLSPKTPKICDEAERMYYAKELAEKVMCRSLWLISLFTICVTPKLFSDDQWIRWGQSPWVPVFEIFALVVFLELGTGHQNRSAENSRRPLTAPSVFPPGRPFSSSRHTLWCRHETRTIWKRMAMAPEFP